MAQETTVEFDFTVFEMVMIGRTPHKKAFERDDDADRAIATQAPSNGSAASIWPTAASTPSPAARSNGC